MVQHERGRDPLGGCGTRCAARSWAPIPTGPRRAATRRRWAMIKERRRAMIEKRAPVSGDV